MDFNLSFTTADLTTEEFRRAKAILRKHDKVPICKFDFTFTWPGDRNFAEFATTIIENSPQPVVVASPLRLPHQTTPLIVIYESGACRIAGLVEQQPENRLKITMDDYWCLLDIDSRQPPPRDGQTVSEKGVLAAMVKFNTPKRQTPLMYQRIHRMLHPRST